MKLGWKVLVLAIAVAAIIEGAVLIWYGAGNLPTFVGQQLV